MKKVISIGIIVLFVVSGVSSIGVTQNTHILLESDMSFHFQFNEPTIRENDEYYTIKIDDLQSYNNPGDPVVPIKTVKILIPYGKSIKNIEINGQYSRRRCYYQSGMDFVTETRA